MACFRYKNILLLLFAPVLDRRWKEPISHTVWSCRGKIVLQVQYYHREVRDKALSPFLSEAFAICKNWKSREVRCIEPGGANNDIDFVYVSISVDESRRGDFLNLGRIGGHFGRIKASRYPLPGVGRRQIHLVFVLSPPTLRLRNYSWRE
jgi:hypothetical protein